MTFAGILKLFHATGGLPRSRLLRSYPETAYWEVTFQLNSQPLI